MCNFAAAWGTVSLQMDTAEDTPDDRVSSKIVKDSDQAYGSSPAPNTIVLVSEDIPDDLDWDYPLYPQRPISIAEEWAQSLDPVVQSANKTVFQLIMQEHFDIQGPNSIWAFTASLKLALTLMISNGLGRVSFNSTLQGNPKSITSPDGKSWIDGNYWLSGRGNVFTVDPEDAKNWVKFHVDSKLQGYAYNTQTVPPRLAIAVMIAYCIIALSHLLYSSITGKSLHPPTKKLAPTPLTFHPADRDNLNMLGLHQRAHRPRSEFGSYRSLAQHLCWDQGAAHLPAPRTRGGGT